MVINSYTRRHNTKTIFLIATARSNSDRLLTFSALRGLYKLLVLVTRTGIIVRVPPPLGRAVAQWLRHYATNRQVAGSIPDGVIGSFQ